jgi:hypothetical protein
MIELGYEMGYAVRGIDSNAFPLKVLRNTCDSDPRGISGDHIDERQAAVSRLRLCPSTQTGHIRVGG